MSGDGNIFNNLAEKAMQHLAEDKAIDGSAGQTTGTDLGLTPLQKRPQPQAGKKADAEKKPAGPNT